MAPTRAPRGQNPTNNPEQWPAGGLVPLRLWKGLRSTSPPAPEEVRHDRVKQRGLTNPYIAKPASRTCLGRILHAVFNESRHNAPILQEEHDKKTMSNVVSALAANRNLHLNITQPRKLNNRAGMFLEHLLRNCGIIEVLMRVSLTFL